MYAMFGIKLRGMTKAHAWAEYLRAITAGATGRQIAQATGIGEATISRWLKGTTDPAPRQVVTVARAYDIPPLDALIATGYLSEEEANRQGGTPRTLQLREFTDHELALEMLRRVDDGKAHPELEDPLDGDHPAMQEHVGAKVTELRPVVGGRSDDFEHEPRAAGSDRTQVSPEDVEP